MKFKKLIKYVEDSYSSKPSFLILMSDGKEYISNGCVFKENTPENIATLVEQFECEEHIDRLLNAPDNPDVGRIKNLRSMFQGCEGLTEFTADLSSLTDGLWMFQGCKNLSRNLRD